MTPPRAALAQQLWTPIEAQLEAHPRARRWFRYIVTSGISTVLSEAVLLGLYAIGGVGAFWAAMLANLVGAAQSYLMSRYWIWPEANRERAGRQVVLYWLTSVASMLISSTVTQVSSQHAPEGQAAHAVVVGVAYVGTYALLWVAKFLVYQKVIFTGRRGDHSVPTPGEAAALARARAQSFSASSE